MRFETVHFRIEIPEGFVQTQVPEGYEFVDPARGEQICLSITQRDDVSARTLGADAELTLAARKTLAQERSAGRAHFDEVTLESRRGVERRALAAYEPTSQAAMWSAVAVYPSLFVIMDYTGGRDTSPARVAEQGRLVFDSLRADDFERRRLAVQARLSERVDPNRLYVYPVSREFLENHVEGREQGAAQRWGHLYATAVERVDEVSRFLTTRDVRSMGLSHSEAYLLGQLNMERDFLAGAFPLQDLDTVDGKPVFLIEHPWAASTLCSRVCWLACARQLGARDLTMTAIDRGAVIVQPDHPRDAVPRLEPLRAELAPKFSHKPLPPGWFHFSTDGRLVSVGEQAIDMSDSTAVYSAMLDNLSRGDVEQVIALGAGTPPTPMIVAALQLASKTLGRVDQAYAYGELAREPDGRIRMPEVAHCLMNMLLDRGDASAAEALLEDQPRDENELTCAVLTVAQRLHLHFGRLEQAQRLADATMARLGACPMLWPLLADAAYNVACTYARCGDRARTIDTVRFLKKQGYSALQDLAADSDMSKFQNDPEFRALVFGDLS